MSPRSVPATVRVSIVALAIMFGLAFVVSGANAVTRADTDILTWVADRRTPFVVDLAEWVSWLGNILVLGTVTIVAGLVAASRRGRDPLAALPAIAVALAAIINPLAKLAVGRPRPPEYLAEIVESATGYPSGHSAQSAAAWIGLGILIASRSEHPRRWIAVGAALAFLVGLSRVVLGVHSPTDLIGGWSLGLACLLLPYAAFVARGDGLRLDAPAPRTTEAPQ